MKWMFKNVNSQHEEFTCLGNCSLPREISLVVLWKLFSCTYQGTKWSSKISHHGHLFSGFIDRFGKDHYKLCQKKTCSMVHVLCTR